MIPKVVDRPTNNQHKNELSQSIDHIGISISMLDRCFVAERNGTLVHRGNVQNSSSVA